MSQQTGQVIFGDYVVGIIDVLNQREKLRQWFRPQDQVGLTKLIGLMKETYGPVTQFREMLRKIIDDVAKKTTEPPIEEFRSFYEKLSPEQKEQLEKVQQVDVGMAYYSDTIVLYSRLVNANNVPQLSGFFAFLAALGGTMLAALAAKVAIRGSIEVGLAGPLPEGDIYGPAIVLAHDLESHVAQHPRIVVGREAMTYLDFVIQNASPHPFDQLARSTAMKCRNLISPDPVDGWPIVDYLGAGFIDLMSAKLPTDAFRSALEFIDHEYETYVKVNDVKLAPRYERVRSYFLANRAAWTAKNEEK